MIEKITNYIKEQSKWFWLTILLTVIADAVNTMYFETVQAFFFNILEGKDAKAMTSLIVIYVFFIILLIFIGMMSSYGKRSYRTKKQNRIQKFAGFMSVLMITGYGTILLMPSTNILGITDNTSNFSDDQQYTYFMILIGLYFVMFAFAFIELKTRL